MHNLGDDNELDRLSREAADKYDAPGNASWQNIQEQLDKIMPVEKKRFAFLWRLLPVLLLGGLVYLRMDTKNDKVQPTEKNNTASNTDKNPAAPVPSQEKFVVVPAGKTMIAGVTAEKLPVTAFSSNNNIPKQNKENILLKTKGSILTVLPRQPTVPALSAVTNKTVTGNEPNNTDPARQPAAVTHENSAVTGITPASNKNDHELLAVQSAAGTMSSPANTIHTTVALPAYGKGWSISLLAGVDKSTVKFRYGNDPGYNIGVVAGYHFNNRLSVHTGAIYTRKNYKLAGEDFTAPKGSWISYYKLENVDGYCHMWEVPLQLRYAVSNHGKNSFFISTGLSSYFMTSEDYNYFFYMAGQPVTRKVVYPSTDTHILSMAHFSVGVENRINKTLSLQVEPYAKLPLSGVGLGNIKLSSFGVNFGLQMRQPAKK